MVWVLNTLEDGCVWDFHQWCYPELIYQMNFMWGHPQHTIINVQGLTGGDGARIQNSPQVNKWASSTGKLLNVGNWFASLNGSTDDTKLVRDMTAFLQEVFDPRGKLILTGKSRGGMNILQLCRFLQQRCRFFKLKQVTEGLPDNHPKGQFWDNDGSSYIVELKVDALYVMDATFDADNRQFSQSAVPEIVRSYVNYFQTREGNGGVHRRLAAGSTTSRVDNDWSNRIPYVRWRESAHDYLINRLAQPDVDNRVIGDLNAPDPPIPVLRSARPGR